MMLKHMQRRLTRDESARIDEWVKLVKSKAKTPRRYVVTLTICFGLLGYGVFSIIAALLVDGPLNEKPHILIAIILLSVTLGFILAGARMRKYQALSEEGHAKSAAYIRENGMVEIFEVEPGRILKITTNDKDTLFIMECGPDICFEIDGGEVRELHQKKLFPCTRFTVETFEEVGGIWKLDPAGPYKEPNEALEREWPLDIGDWGDAYVRNSSFDELLEDAREHKIPEYV